MGGSSAERDISLDVRHGRACRPCKAVVLMRMRLTPRSKRLGDLKRLGFHRAFIALHGRLGEDGAVQGALELLGLPYTGSGVMASAIAMDKVMTKRVWVAEGLPTPRWINLASHQQDRTSVVSVPDTLGLPVIVKPPHEGSSIGVTKVEGYSQMQDAVQLAARFDADVLCEEFIEGDEVTCPVLGAGAAARALPVVRIVAPADGYDYQNKYFTDNTHYHCPSGLACSRRSRHSAHRFGGVPHAGLPWLGPCGT